ncbi:putative Hsp70 chaperone [Terfezia boudieri ATCC MYA-4762]|uniref:Putative Hsp70 chaperone n=1 Tax=Terfezia boudieri ATCC MYA-4762 TaxID=1051890 RepID=A0A3N4LFJ7_9PEZI|nr:putative Hsp70 chaperone [Terfezia boudieri ATCC MYA-4762]
MSDTTELPEKTVIGISFGNTNSSIAFTGPDGKAEIIANEEGDRQIPSVLSYVESEEYHGAQAKLHLVRNPTNTVAYFRDYIGKKYADIDPTNSHASAHPIEVDGSTAFKIQEKNDAEPALVSVSEVTTRHLRRLITSATDFLGRDVNAAVVTVPTDFTDAQREALCVAAKAANLEILQFIHEPVAAVLAYTVREESTIADKNVVVADFGGTRSDVTIITARGGMYTILATAHDYELGGARLDDVLVQYFAKEFQKKNKVDPLATPRGLAKLKQEVDFTKKTLSLSTTATISIDSLAEGYDFHSNINRTRYELLAKNVFDQMVKLVEGVVTKAGLDLLDIDEVILAGGASHTPRIAQRLAAIFPESTQILAPATCTASLNPSELAARGAAMQASLVQDFEKEDIDQATHPAVTIAPHLAKTIGVAIANGGETEHFCRLLESDTALPARRTAQFEVAQDGDVLVKICEGVREIVVTKPEKNEKAEKTGEDEGEEEEGGGGGRRGGGGGGGGGGGD